MRNKNIQSKGAGLIGRKKTHKVWLAGLLEKQNPTKLGWQTYWKNKIQSKGARLVEKPQHTRSWWQADCSAYKDSERTSRWLRYSGQLALRNVDRKVVGSNPSTSIMTGFCRPWSAPTHPGGMGPMGKRGPHSRASSIAGFVRS